MRYALTLCFFLATATCVAQENSQPTPAAWTGAYSGFIGTRYFGPTISRTFADQGVLQEELDVTRQFGDTAITGTIWNSIGFDRWFQNYAYETDLGVTVGRKIGKFFVSGTAGIFLLNPNAGFDVLELNFKASRTFVNGNDAFTPFIEFQNRAVVGKENIHGSQYPMAGIAWHHKLAKRLSFETVFRENYDIRGGFGRRSGTSLFYSEASLRMRLTESMGIIFPRVSYGGSYDDPARPGQFVWSAGITKRF